MRWAAWLLPLAGLSACGGGAGDPLTNPATIANPGQSGAQVLAFAYFQRCVEPVFEAQLPIQLNGQNVINTCAAAGCHADQTGTGGALRLIPGAAALPLDSGVNTPTVIRASDIYRNYTSAAGEVVVGDPADSRLLNKPLLRNVLHGGGLVFPSVDDPHAQIFTYWITHPSPVGQDEFSTATYSMFTPADPDTGTCNTN